MGFCLLIVFGFVRSVEIRANFEIFPLHKRKRKRVGVGILRSAVVFIAVRHGFLLSGFELSLYSALYEHRHLTVADGKSQVKVLFWLPFDDQLWIRQRLCIDTSLAGLLSWSTQRNMWFLRVATIQCHKTTGFSLAEWPN